VDQVGRKDFMSQNFSFLALMAEAVVEVQILRTATATHIPLWQVKNIHASNKRNRF
jgi:hypothetical protein